MVDICIQGALGSILHFFARFWIAVKFAEKTPTHGISGGENTGGGAG